MGRITSWSYSSCYGLEESSVKEAVIQLCAFNIGCLAVTNSANKVVVVFSESDCIKRVSSLDRNFQYTK